MGIKIGWTREEEEEEVERGMRELLDLRWANRGAGGEAHRGNEIRCGARRR